jgi:hypothetical protein
MTPIHDHVGAEQVEGGWIGTVQNLDGRIARVTHLAPTEERAKAAAARWYVRTDNKDIQWWPCPGRTDRWRAIWLSRLGPRPWPLERI